MECPPRVWLGVARNSSVAADYGSITLNSFGRWRSTRWEAKKGLFQLDREKGKSIESFMLARPGSGLFTEAEISDELQREVGAVHVESLARP